MLYEPFAPFQQAPTYVHHVPGLARRRGRPASSPASFGQSCRRSFVDHDSATAHSNAGGHRRPRQASGPIFRTGVHPVYVKRTVIHFAPVARFPIWKQRFALHRKHTRIASRRPGWSICHLFDPAGPQRRKVLRPFCICFGDRCRTASQEDPPTCESLLELEELWPSAATDRRNTFYHSKPASVNRRR